VPGVVVASPALPPGVVAVSPAAVGDSGPGVESPLGLGFLSFWPQAAISSAPAIAGIQILEFMVAPVVSGVRTLPFEPGRDSQNVVGFDCPDV
jgi:hypothetical protein